MSKSVIKTFKVGDRFFCHEIDSKTDNVDCLDEDGELLLTYTSDCRMLKPDDSQHGTFSQHGGSSRCRFVGQMGAVFTSRHIVMLLAEVEYSVHLIESGQIGKRIEHEELA